jgi:protein O-GlcNAc transferase
MAVSTTADLLQEGLVLHRRGAIAEAAARYADVLRANPGNADAHYYLGMICCQDGRFAEGAERARQALASDPRHVRAHVLLGRALNALERRGEALACFDRAISLAPDFAQAHSHRADVLSELGRHSEAVDNYNRAVALAPDAIADWFNRGLALDAVGRREEAVSSFDRAIAGRPDFVEGHLQRARVLSELGLHDAALESADKAVGIAPSVAEAWLARGNILRTFKRHDDALAAYDKALAIAPDLAEAWLGRGGVFAELKRHDDALSGYDKALALKPDLAPAWLSRGGVLAELKRYDDALAGYDKALALKPDLTEAWLGRGNVFTELARHSDAFAAYEKALALEPDLAEAWLGRGNVFTELKRYDDAFTAYETALDLKPGLAQAWLGRGTILTERARHGEAAAAYDRALALKPDLKYAAGSRLKSRLLECDWTNLTDEVDELLLAIRAGKPASVPFTVLSIPSTAADQLQCAKRYVQDQPSFPALWRGEAYSHDRIRVAYLSADFYEHAVAQLSVGLFEKHDRSRFEVTGISFGPDQNSPMRQRIKAGVEHFVDVRDKSDREIAELIRRLEIDIAVDLMGFTSNNRLNVLAHRPAPVQVNYLGYPGTMGASYIDYILADPTVIPEDQCQFYSEQVVWLPDSYQINDDQRKISNRTPTRGECGLPDTAFVFCCFNNLYKIMPPIFEIWMRLLKKTENSVLWLLERNAITSANLCREAEKCGVSAQRLVFAPVAKLPDHLARHRQADLFLDTLPYNAHTTASDALWAGLPVLTCLGSTFAGRVAASLLKAAGVDELITPTLQDYEALALKLAHDPSDLASTKKKLARTRDVCPLFNTERASRQIESAYTKMWQRHQQGHAPQAMSDRSGPMRID